MDGIYCRDVYLYSVVCDFLGRVGIFTEFPRFLYASRVGIFVSKLDCAPDSDDFFFATTTVDAWCVYGNIECRNGGAYNLDFAERFDGGLGCNRELFDDFLD